MPVVIAASLVFYFGWWIVSGEWQFAASLSLGPIAVFFLFDETNRKIGSLDIPARRWLEDLFSAAMLGFLYTGGVFLCLAIIYLVILQRDEMAANPLLLSAAHFAPHLVLQGKRYWTRRLC